MYGEIIERLLKQWKEEGYDIEDHEIGEDDFIRVKFWGKESEVRLKRLVEVKMPDKDMTFRPNEIQYPDEFQPLTGIEMFCRGEQVICEDCESSTFDFDSMGQEFYCGKCGFLITALDIIRPDLKPVPFHMMEAKPVE